MNDTTKKVSDNRAKKNVIVAQLTEKTAKAKAFVFTNYQGMTHKQLEGLKKGLRTANAEFVVAKNTLLKIALKNSNVTAAEGQEESMDGPTGTIFAYDDAILPIKELAKTIKSLKMPLIKFGILNNKLLAEADVIRLSTLPSREVLLAKLVGSMKSPIYGLHRALNWNIQKFVMTLKAIETKKA